jgi:hypothetical protein
MEVVSLLRLLFWLLNRVSSSFCRSPARPFFSAASRQLKSGCRASRTCRPFQRRFPVSAHPCGSGCGPGKMPPDLVAKIHANVSTALDHPETAKLSRTNSFERVDLSPQDFGKLIQSDLKHWGALIKAVGAKIG